jgi:hypothetical protein
MPVILATQEAEIRRIMGFEVSLANSSGDPISKKPSQKRAGGMVQGIGPEFKLLYCKKESKSNRPKVIQLNFSNIC